jgi:hypothetical protein
MKNYQNNLPVFLSILIMTGFSYSGYTSEEKVQFYVSTAGNDSHKGTAEQPFATFQAAQNAIRNYKTKGQIAPVEVIIRGGVYYLDETLELKPEDSGTEAAPVTWRAAENEKVILSGGKPLGGKWKIDSDGKTWYIDLPATKGWKRDIEQPEKYEQKPAGTWHFRRCYFVFRQRIHSIFRSLGTGIGDRSGRII